MVWQDSRGNTTGICIIGPSILFKNDYVRAFNNVKEAKRLADEKGLSFRENW